MELANDVSTYWANFAKSGNPNVPSKVVNAWPSYSARPNRAKIPPYNQTQVLIHMYKDGCGARAWIP